MKNRNHTFALIYLVLAGICLFRAVLALIRGQDLPSVLFRGVLALLFFIVAILYRRKE